MFRTHKYVTRLLGFSHHVSQRNLEIDINYKCNVLCCNCSRSCAQAPSREQMTPEQIRHFVSENIEKGHTWKKIKICGGEPTLHPRIEEIVSILLKYRQVHSPETVIELDTAGHGPEVNRVIERLPAEINIVNSNKTPEMKPLFVPVHQSGRMRVARMTTQAVYNMLQKRAGQADIADVTPHDFRRTAISNLIDATDLATAQAIAGHADPKTTARYDRRGERKKQEAAALLTVAYTGRR